VAPLTTQLDDAESAQRMRRALKLRILLAEALYRSGQSKLSQSVWVRPWWVERV
jgi:LuxR family maltose regulon positive regulatory protein